MTDGAVGNDKLKVIWKIYPKIMLSSILLHFSKKIYAKKYIKIYKFCKYDNYIIWTLFGMYRENRRNNVFSEINEQKEITLNTLLWKKI